MATVVRTHCNGCNRTGSVKLGTHRPRWCRCPVGTGGPYTAPEGYGAVFLFGLPPVDEAWEANAAKVRGAFFDARGALRSGIWTGRGDRIRQLPKSSPKRRRLEKAYDVARAAMLKLRKTCTHRDLVRLNVYDEERDCSVEQHECTGCLDRFEPQPGVYARAPGTTLRRAS